jgi:hypothetical protein
MFWAAVHIDFLIGNNRFFVMLQWGFAFITKRRQARHASSPTSNEPTQFVAPSKFYLPNHEKPSCGSPTGNEPR